MISVWGTSSSILTHVVLCLTRPEKGLRLFWYPYSRATLHLEGTDIIKTTLRDIWAGAGELHPLALEILLIIDGYLKWIEMGQEREPGTAVRIGVQVCIYPVIFISSHNPGYLMRSLPV